MGRYSDSDEDYKKKKRRSRSRSNSVDSYSHHKKKKKSKSKKSVRSRSNSSERSYRSSKSKQSRRSRSCSRDRRSRSRTKDRSRRSRSRDRYSKSRRSRSGSGSRSKNRRSRSRSRSRRSRSRSRRSKSKDKKSPSVSKSRDPTEDIPGFAEMSAAEQAEKRLQLAIKAAAAADEKVKKEGSMTTNVSLTFDEQHRRAKAIESIDSDSFFQAQFKSSRDQKVNTAEDFGHDAAMFGTGVRPASVKTEPLDVKKHPDSILHPKFFVSAEEKMPRWIQKLTNMRKKKLEGETFG